MVAVALFLFVAVLCFYRVATVDRIVTSAITHDWTRRTGEVKRHIGLLHQCVAKVYGLRVVRDCLVDDLASGTGLREEKSLMERSHPPGVNDTKRLGLGRKGSLRSYHLESCVLKDGGCQRKQSARIRARIKNAYAKGQLPLENATTRYKKDDLKRNSAGEFILRGEIHTDTSLLHDDELSIIYDADDTEHATDAMKLDRPDAATIVSCEGLMIEAAEAYGILYKTLEAERTGDGRRWDGSFLEFQKRANSKDGGRQEWWSKKDPRRNELGILGTALYRLQASLYKYQNIMSAERLRNPRDDTHLPVFFMNSHQFSTRYQSLLDGERAILHVDSHTDTSLLRNEQLKVIEGLSKRQAGEYPKSDAEQAAIIDAMYGKLDRAHGLVMAGMMGVSRDMIWLKPTWETTKDVRLTLEAVTTKSWCGKWKFGKRTHWTHSWIYNVPAKKGREGVEDAVELIQAEIVGNMGDVILNDKDSNRKSLKMQHIDDDCHKGLTYKRDENEPTIESDGLKNKHIDFSAVTMEGVSTEHARKVHHCLSFSC